MNCNIGTKKEISSKVDEYLTILTRNSATYCIKAEAFILIVSSDEKVLAISLHI